MKEKKKLLDYLPKNYAETIAENLNVSTVLVYKVRMGERKNNNILEKLVELAKAEKLREESLLNEIENEN